MKLDHRRHDDEVDPMSETLRHSPHCLHESQDLEGVRREVLALATDILSLLKVQGWRVTRLQANGTATCCIACTLGSAGALLLPPKQNKTYINRHRSRHTSPVYRTLDSTLHITFIIIYEQPERYQPWSLGSRSILWSWSPLVAWIRLKLWFGEEVAVVSGRGASASPSFVATICSFCREINCSCDIVRAESVCWKCVDTVELYTQP